jgi:DNA 3'-phosphatase
MATVSRLCSGKVLRGRPIAAFDFDSTLQVHRGKGPDEILTARFLVHLSRSFNIVIFSNRRCKGNTDAIDEYLGLVRRSVATIDPAGGPPWVSAEEDSKAFVEQTPDLPISYFGSLAHDRFRKPHRGMWEMYIRHLESLGYSTSDPGYFGSFFCGDAAGRPGDFAATDLTFAAHCGLRFVTPERIFGRSAFGVLRWEEPRNSKCDPDAGYSTDDLNRLKTPVDGFRASVAIQVCLEQWQPTKRVCVVMMGGQASGKSTVATELGLLGFRVVSQENVSPQSYRKTFTSALLSGQNIVVDGTHPTRDSRALLIEQARQKSLHTAIIHVTTPKSICQHLNAARCELDKTNRTKEIPDVAIHTYWKKREIPTAEEADIIVEFPFRLRPNAPLEISDFRYG